MNPAGNSPYDVISNMDKDIQCRMISNSVLTDVPGSLHAFKVLIELTQE